jgi:hypothetical protein
MLIGWSMTDRQHRDQVHILHGVMTADFTLDRERRI